MQLEVSNSALWSDGFWGPTGGSRPPCPLSPVGPQKPSDHKAELFIGGGKIFALLEHRGLM